MATVDFFSAFTYEWAETGAVFDWDDAQYKLGWATVGSTPPTVEQFNRVHQIADEKANWLYGQLASAAAAKGISLSAGDLDSLKNILAAYTPAASETVAGIAEIATQAEVTTGTDDARIITPLKLATAVPAASTSAAGKIQLASAAEAQALSANDRAITPLSLDQAFKGANQSIPVGPVSWYQKLPGGLMIQGGITVNALTDYLVSFPLAFTSDPFSVVATTVGNNASLIGIMIDVATPSQFAVRIRNSTAGVSNITVNWLAVGRWI